MKNLFSFWWGCKASSILSCAHKAVTKEIFVHNRLKSVKHIFSIRKWKCVRNSRRTHWNHLFFWLRQHIKLSLKISYIFFQLLFPFQRGLGGKFCVFKLQKYKRHFSAPMKTLERERRNKAEAMWTFSALSLSLTWFFKAFSWFFSLGIFCVWK